jgi:AmmeMemoRadiSam system protein A
MTALPEGAGPVLTGIARRVIADRLGLAASQDGSAPQWLDAPGAAFVTLTIDGALRGCIGSLEAWRPLADDVRSNALSAAFGDPRFPPLGADEFANTAIEVSVLSAPEPFPIASRADAIARLRPGVDGVILEAGGRRGTFLPQVWEELPEPAEFLDHLARKAGLRYGYWSDEFRLWRYGVTAFTEAG